MSFNNSFIVNILGENLEQDQSALTPLTIAPRRQALPPVPCLIQRLPPCSAFTEHFIYCVLTII